MVIKRTELVDEYGRDAFIVTDGYRAKKGMPWSWDTMAYRFGGTVPYLVKENCRDKANALEYHNYSITALEDEGWEVCTNVEF